MATVDIVGGPLPYVEALSARLLTKGHHVVDTDGTAQAEAVLVYCANEEAWVALQLHSRSAAVVAVLPDMSPSGYSRALAMGSGVVCIDTSTEIIVDVLEASLDSEALLPMAVARQLVGDWKPSPAVGHLAPFDQDLAAALASGKTVQQIAQDLSYSDRTVRRKVQALYVKLGAKDRHEAIEIFERMASH